MIVFIKTSILYIFSFLCYFPLRRKVTKGATKGKGRLRFHPFPLETQPHRFVCAIIVVNLPLRNRASAPLAAIEGAPLFVRTFRKEWCKKFA